MKVGFQITVNTNWAKEQRNVVATSATQAARAIAFDTKSRARQMIGSSWKGMSGGMQNALRVDVYPRGGVSLEPSMVVRHNAAYSGVFEGPKTTTISRNALLWIPLPSAKPLMPRFRSGMSAKSDHYVMAVGNKVGGFVYVPGRSGKPPLLCARYDVNSKGKIRKAYKAKAKRTQSQLTPLFFGMPAVRIKGRWNLAEITKSEWARMSTLYTAGIGK